MPDSPDPRTQAAFVEALMRRNYEAVGFIPRPRIEQYVERGQVLIATENDEPAGFLVYGNGEQVTRIYQACVEYDARRRDLGLALVGQLVRAATRRGALSVSLWCADDLEANEFWRAAGFVFAGKRDVGNVRGRLHNRWVLRLQPDLGLVS